MFRWAIIFAVIALHAVLPWVSANDYDHTVSNPIHRLDVILRSNYKFSYFFNIVYIR